MVKSNYVKGLNARGKCLGLFLLGCRLHNNHRKEAVFPPEFPPDAKPQAVFASVLYGFLSQFILPQFIAAFYQRENHFEASVGLDGTGSMGGNNDGLPCCHVMLHSANRNLGFAFDNLCKAVEGRYAFR